jgi:hypothetical protein
MSARAEHRFSGCSSNLKNNVEKRTVDFKLTIVANEAQLPTPVHEKVNPQAVPRECDRFSTPARSARFPWQKQITPP